MMEIIGLVLRCKIGLYGIDYGLLWEGYNDTIWEVNVDRTSQYR